MKAFMAMALLLLAGMTAHGRSQDTGGKTMHLYLIRHGDAVDEGQDPRRPLSDKGKAEAEKIARYLASLSIKPDRILHSPKLRAAETAKILEGHLHPVNDAEEADGLLPKDPPKEWRKRLKDLRGGIVLVGHLPHLGLLASLLLSDDAEKIRLAVATGGVICLRRGAQGGWALEWMIAPDQIK
jgi:phosphohistidine phosphatase